MNYADRKEQLELQFRQIKDRLELLEAERMRLRIELHEIVGKTGLVNELIEEDKKKATPPPPPD